MIDAILSGQFDTLLTWQRFYPMQQDIIDAIQMSNLQTVVMDFGFVPHYESVVFDTAGDNVRWRQFDGQC